MTDFLTLLAFVPAALALNLTPGADMMFCLGQGLRFGPRAAWAASAGVALGGLTHSLIAGIGLASLMAAAPWSFEIVRWIGVAYLLWLAFQLLMTKGPLAQTTEKTGHAFRSAYFVNLTNPKVALFILAFVPQFIRPDAGPVLAQFMIFGSVLGLGGFIINGLVGQFAGHLRPHLSSRNRTFDYVCAGIFAVLAARLALLERS